MSATVSIIEAPRNTINISSSPQNTVSIVGGPVVSLDVVIGGARGAKGLDGSVAGGGVGVSAGASSQNSGIITFQDSHNVSFGLNGGVMTASFAGDDAGGVYSFANSNGVTFGDNGSTITASVKTDYLTTAAASDHGHVFSAAGGSSQFQTLQFANSNGVSFSNSNGSVVGSVAAATPQTEQTQSRFNLSLAGITAGVMAMVSSGVMTLAATNNITLSQAGNAVTISGPATHAQQTGISAVSAGAGSISAGTVVFSNSNGVSFGLNGSTLTGSHNGLTTAALSNHSHGNPTLNLTNLSGTTASGSNGLTISLSASLGGGAGDGYNIFAAGSQTATTAGTVNFANSNGISFGMSNSSQITASYTVPVIPGATSFANANNVSFGLNGSTITATATFAQSLQTQNSIQVLGSSGNISLANQNGITFGGNGSTITASHNGLTTAMASNASSGFMLTGERANYLTTAALSGHSHGVTLNLTNINGTTGGNSQGINLSLSAVIPAQTVQPVAYSAANGSANFSTLTFANSNGISFSTGTQGIFGTVKTDYLTTAANSTHSHGNPTLNLTNVSGTTGSNSGGLTLSLSAGSIPGATSFSNLNGISFGLAGSTITASHNGLTTAMQSQMTSNFMSTSERANYFATNANTFANSTHSHGNPSLQLTNISGTTASNSNGLTLSLSAAAGGAGGGVAISAGSELATSGTIHFANSNGVTFGMSGSSQITASVNGGGGYVAPGRNMIEIIQGERLTTIMNFSASQISRRPMFVPFWMDGTNLVPKTVRLMVSGGASSNRSLVATFAVGLYSKANDTQLSLLGSDSQAFSLTASSQSTVWNGVRIMDFTGLSSLAMTVEGRWVLGMYFSASSHNATFANVLLYGADNMPSISGFMIGGTTSATNASSNVFPFWGLYSATSGGLPDSVGMSQIYGGNSASLIDPYAIIKEV